MSNKPASYPATAAVPPLHRYGGRIAALGELPVHASGDTYTVDGNGTVTRLPSLPHGVPIHCVFTGTPTFVNSSLLKMQGGVNYTFAVGDACILLPEGNGSWRCFVLPATVTSAAPPLRGYISGLTLSNDGVTPNTILDIAAGIATDTTAVSSMVLASAYTKTTGAWAVGTGNGALDTGTIAASTWYHVFLIQRSDTGIVDLLFSLSATSPTMPASGAYNRQKRLGSFKTDGSSHIIPFTQISNQFTWVVPILSFNSTVGTARSSITLAVPTGVVVSAAVVANGGSSGNSTIWVGPLTVTDGTPSLTASPPGMLFFQNVAGATSSSGGVNMMTNTSAQVGANADVAATSLKILVNGWTDFL